MEVLRSCKVPLVLAVVLGTVWVAGLERDLTQRVKAGLVLPPIDPGQHAAAKAALVLDPEDVRAIGATAKLLDGE